MDKKIFLILFLILALWGEEGRADSNYSAYGLSGRAEGMRFKVYAYNNERAAQVLARAEDIYQRLLRNLGQGGLMFKDCLIFFWKDQEAFLKESRKMAKGSVSEWAAAFADYQFSRRQVAIFACENEEIFSNILPHEITHQVLAQGLCFTGIPHIPIWLNEGLAQHMEEDKEGRHLLISSSINGNNYFKLTELTSAYTYPSEGVSLFYAQSLSLVEYLLENYSGEKLYSLARRLVREMTPMEKALKDSYWPALNNINDLEKQWLAWIKGKDYYRRAAEMKGEGQPSLPAEFLSLTSSQKEIIEGMKKKAEKANNGYIWRSQHFSVRMEYSSLKELEIKEARALEDIYGAVLFILEEAYTKIGEDMDYHPGGIRDVYLYAPTQYSLIKESRSHEEMITAYKNDLVMEIKKVDGIRADLAAFLYHYYAHIVLLNKGKDRRDVKFHEPIAIEWEKRGEAFSVWNKK